MQSVGPKSSSLQPKSLTKRLMDPLHGRIRAIKDASDSSSHTDSRSDIDDPCDAENSFLLGQSKGSLRKNSKDEEKEEKDVSTILSQKTLATQQLISEV